MATMIIPLALLLVGAILLIVALKITNVICRDVEHAGPGWKLLSYLIIFFVVGYASYGVLIIQSEVTPTEFVVATILCAGGIFVLLVSRLSLLTFHNVKRIASLERHRALHDGLTDLPNRVLLLERLEQALQYSHRYNEPLIVMVMDLDRFKDINDTLGHHYGDMLLQQVAPRLHSAVREVDTVARLGGDEFAILLPRLNIEQAMVVADKVASIVQQPFTIEGQHLNVGLSIGITSCPDHGTTSDVLLQRADIAMYVAKRGEKNYAIYNEEQDQYTLNRLVMIGDLSTAVDNSEFLLHFQPKVDVKTMKVCGIEALVRWQHPQHGLILPDEFIPLAQQTGLVGAMTNWVLDAALEQVAEWDRLGYRFNIAVNLSVKNLTDSKFPHEVATRLADYNLDTSRLILEITEDAIMDDPERSMKVIKQLHTEGVQFSIDDFGTGYSSLFHLKRLPVDEIKIDKSFVMDMISDENDAIIVRSTIDLAHNMGRKVIAEGVDHIEILELLEILGCDMVQGHFLSPPLPAEDLIEWVEIFEKIGIKIGHRPV